MFEVSVHRATTALKKLNRRRRDLMDEAPRVCNYCEANHTVQKGNCSTRSLDSARGMRARLFELSAVRSLRIHPFRGMEESRAFHLLAASKILANSQAPESESIAGCTRTHWSRSVVFLASSQC